MDSEKQMVFTNNIPKTGFLITPTGPISRHRRQVSLSRGASRRGQVSLPCCGKVFPVPLNRGPQRPQTQASGEGPGVPWADKPSPLRNMDSCGEKVRAESFLLTQIADRGQTRWVFCAQVPKVVFCKKNLTTLYHSSNHHPPTAFKKRKHIEKKFLPCSKTACHFIHCSSWSVISLPKRPLWRVAVF